MLNYFNSSQMGPELVPYMKVAKIGPPFLKMNNFTFTFRVAYLSDKRGSVLQPVPERVSDCKAGRVGVLAVGNKGCAQVSDRAGHCHDGVFCKELVRTTRL